MTSQQPRYSRQQLLSAIDHTYLKPEGTPEQALAVVREALAHGFKAACVRPSDVVGAASLLANSAISLCTVVGFPHGNSATESKVTETRIATAAGAVEVDMVINQGWLRAGMFAEVRADIAAVAEAAHAGGAILKVIFETCNLTDGEIVAACEASVSAGADFVKTSTGFASGGATVEAVALMRATVGPNIGVKASGGIRTLADAIAMLDAGASRIGCSASVSILAEYDAATN